MEGIPEDVVQQHNQRLIQNFYQAQADRFAATGNPPPGQSGKEGPVKKIKIETADEIKKRLAEHRARVAAQKAAGGVANPTPPLGLNGQSPGQNVSFYHQRNRIKQITNINYPELSFPSARRPVSPGLPSSGCSWILTSPAIPPGRLQLPAWKSSRKTRRRPSCTTRFAGSTRTARLRQYSRRACGWCSTTR